MADLPLSLLFLVGTVIVAVCTIVYVAISERERRETMQRVSPETDPSRLAERLLLNEDA